MFNKIRTIGKVSQTAKEPIKAAAKKIKEVFKSSNKDTVSKYKKNALKMIKDATAKVGKDTKAAESRIGKDAAQKIGRETKSKMMKDYLKYNRDLKAKGGRAGFNKGSKDPVGKKKNKFPDHSGDGEITQKDILMAKGVIPKPKSKKKVI